MPTFVHGRQTRLLLDNYDVSRYFREVTRSNSADQVDTTTFGASDKGFIAGWQETGITLGGLFESATQIGATPSDTLDKYLQTLLGQETPNALLAIGWTGWSLGSRVTLFEGTETSLETSSPIGDVTSVSLGLASEGPSLTGVSLHDLVAENAGANGASVDNGSQSTRGGAAQLHVPVNTRDASLDVKVQHSSDDGGTDPWADIATFTAVPAGTLASERVPIAGTIKRYTRAIWTLAGSSGATTFQVSVGRR